MTRDDKVREILIGQAAQAYQDGENRRWRACVVARMITTGHRYKHDGARATFADALAIRQTQVDNLSMAGSTYRTLRKWIGLHGAAFGIEPGLLHTIRKNLSMSHFAMMGRLWIKYNWRKGPPLTLEYLYRAVTAEPRLSVDKMKLMVEADREEHKDGEQDTGGNLDNLDSRRDLTHEQRKHAELAGARRAVVLSVSDNGSGYQVTLGTERRSGIPEGAEAWLIVIGGGEEKK